ncbi:hypothetical protein ACE1AT_07710 [Pelatocladus sp. BLCC-F211]|uniref:hypothetical protein n=1 Tax=Pelatocladus sp. BLCC-F211 TaxID=3342752 RepID=UPI0035BA1BEA
MWSYLNSTAKRTAQLFLSYQGNQRPSLGISFCDRVAAAWQHRHSLLSKSDRVLNLSCSCAIASEIFPIA